MRMQIQEAWNQSAIKLATMRLPNGQHVRWRMGETPQLVRSASPYRLDSGAISSLQVAMVWTPVDRVTEDFRRAG